MLYFFYQADVQREYGVAVSYKMAWHGRRKAVEDVYGGWEENFQQLPRYLAAVVVANPGTIVEWKFVRGTENLQKRTLKYVLWAFGPSVATFRECHPVLSVDGTHLRGAYKGKMLVAVTKTANNNIFPVAFALVDKESTAS